jgi:transposase-like protein
MTGTRKRRSAAFSARVALEAAKQTRTLAELARTFQLHPVQISQWKKQLPDGVEFVLVRGNEVASRRHIAEPGRCGVSP